MADEPDLPARIYWAVAVVALLVMAALFWLTQSFHVDLKGNG